MFPQQSDVLFHIGYIPLLLAVFGMLFAKSRFRANFMILLLFLILIMYGKNTFMRAVVDFVFPPFRYARHTQLFGGYFIFALVCFAGMGCDALLGRLPRNRTKVIVGWVLLSIIAVDVLLYASGTFAHVTLKREGLHFDEYAQAPPAFSERRVERVATSEPIRYYKPILHRRQTAFHAATLPVHFTNEHLTYGLDELVSAVRGRDGLVFAAEAGRRNVREFVSYGISAFPRWDERNKLAFLDMIIVMLYDMAANRAFYGAFEKFEGVYMTLRHLIENGYKDIKKNGSDWSFGRQERGLLETLFDLRLRPEPGAGARQYEMMGKLFGFEERTALHGYFFKKIAAADYLEYIWRRNHVQEFVLVLRRDYREFLELAERYPERRDMIIGVQRAAAGISADIIRFYPSAQFMARQEIIDRMTGAEAEDLLLVEGEGAAILPTDGAGGETAGAEDGDQRFEYTVKSYVMS